MKAARPCETTVLGAAVEFHDWRLAQPLQLSSGRIDEVTEARVAVTVRAGECAATGRGTVYLSDLWAWPDASVAHTHRVTRLRELCQKLAETLPVLCGPDAAHPLELGLRLHDAVTNDHADSAQRDIPRLARLLCVSPFDAAIHDATGHALGRSAFSFYDEQTPIPSADRWFAPQSAQAVLRGLLRREPLRTFPATFVVGPDDELDNLFPIWIRARGYRRVKLKLPGKEPATDVERTIEVTRALQDWGVATPWVSVDTNEANPDSASVGEYLERLERADPTAYAAVQYLEQPTSRDFRLHAYDWRTVTSRKPVLLDEGLTSLADLPEARRQGWSGLALKTCKGHSFTLVAAALAARHDMVLALQDLTNPGCAAIHAALLGAFLPTINGLELNSPQFTPQANADWLPRWAPLLEPYDGRHRLSGTLPNGLGGGAAFAPRHPGLDFQP